MKVGTGLLLAEKNNMAEYILGISCYYHDASAALLKDGVIVAAAEEERFTRKKHDFSFPINAIEHCLSSQNITIKDITHVSFYEKPFLKFERILYQHFEAFPFSLKTFLNAMPSWVNQKLRVTKTITKKLKYSGDIFFIEHHLAHAASAFLISPFNEAAILTVDGVGEWTTTAFGVGKGNDIHLIKDISFPHSLGLLYSTITAYLGFSVNNSEYKVMGLSPYGDTNKGSNPYYEKLKKVLDVKDDGSYHFDMCYFIYHYADRMPSKKLCALLGGPIRKPETEISQRHKDIAAALQLVYEEVLFKILHHVYQETKLKNVVLSGGCGLNSVANGKILRESPFEHVWIQPNSSDGGTSIGAASYAYHTILGGERTYTMKDAFLGPEFSTEYVRNYLDCNSINYSEFDCDEALLKTASELLYNNSVVGWFQGKMEWGARALGARSILSNPCNPEAQELLNLKVKHREKFRPFAPVVCEDDAMEYFICDEPIPAATDFMLMVYPVREDWRSKIPSVTHVDGSGRLQTIKRPDQPLYYDLIKEFGKLSGVPILINTSFNIRGEPIVCTPHDAYQCMMGTGIDSLIIDRFIVKRGENPKDMWDSEQYAID